MEKEPEGGFGTSPTPYGVYFGVPPFMETQNDLFDGYLLPVEPKLAAPRSSDERRGDEGRIVHVTTSVSISMAGKPMLCSIKQAPVNQMWLETSGEWRF